MTGFLTAMGGALTAIGVGAVLLGRNWPHPHGRHARGRQTAPVLEAVEALDTTSALCRTEGVVTWHARTRVTRELICMVCHQPSPDPLALHQTTTGD